MAEFGEARSTARDAVVRPLSRAAGRPCARPGCPSPARATLSFRYATREAWVEALSDEPAPATYDLCSQHADATRPPHGWDIVDRRPAEDEPTAVAPVDVDEIGGEHTVAVLAAALRAVPDPVAPSRPAVVEEPAPEVTATIDARETEAAAALRAEVQDALAELQAVAQGTLDLEELEVQAELADEVDVLVHAVEELESDARVESAVADAAAVGTSEDAPSPRPVPAAQERFRDTGAARSW